MKNVALSPEFMDECGSSHDKQKHAPNPYPSTKTGTVHLNTVLTYIIIQ